MELSAKSPSSVEIQELINAYQNIAQKELSFESFGNFIRGFIFDRKELEELLSNGDHLSLCLACHGNGKNKRLEVILSPIKNLQVNLNQGIYSSYLPVTLPISNKINISQEFQINPAEANERLMEELQVNNNILSMSNGSRIIGVKFLKNDLAKLSLGGEPMKQRENEMFIFVPVLDHINNQERGVLNFTLTRFNDGVVDGEIISGIVSDGNTDKYKVATVN